MIKKNTPLLLLLLMAFVAGQSHAQDNKNSIEVSPFVGLQMFSAEGNTLKGNAWGTELVYHINMANNQADWVKMLGIRDVSLAFSYRNMQSVSLSKVSDSNGFLGDYYGAIGRLSILLGQSGKTDFLLTPGFGFGYDTQTYYTNNFPVVGSHVNFTAQLGLKVSTPLSAATRLVAGFDLYHYSNAAVKLPNEGVNSINVSVGIQQNINEAAPKTRQNLFKNYNKHSFEFGLDIGRRGLVQTGGGITPYPSAVAYQKQATSHLYQSGFYLGYNYRLNPVLSLRLGADAVYYYKTLDTVSTLDHFYATYQELGSSYDRVRVGTSVGSELWLGKVSLTANVGYYIHFHYFVPTYDHTYQPPNIYWTFSARYYLTPWMALEAKQYLHRTQADFAGFGLLFRLPRH